MRLCHVDSLIKFLGLIRAKIMIRNDQNPFEQVMYDVAWERIINC